MLLLQQVGVGLVRGLRSRGHRSQFGLYSTSSFGRWAKQMNQFMDQALAGPGTVANTEEVIFQFDREDGRDLRGWRVATDGGIGGSSQADVQVHSEGDGYFARFSGHLCPPFALPVRQKTPEEEAHEAALKAKKAAASEEGGDAQDKEEEEVRLGTAFSVMQTEKGLLQSVINFDLEPFAGLVLRVRGDGRKYIVSLRTENWIVPGAASDDNYQGYIQPKEGEWEEIVLPFSKFLLTWQGKVVNDQTLMNHRNLYSMSFACVGLLPEDKEEKVAGEDQPFCLDVQWVKATVD
ncbi:complex I intermediate-associated protein 30 [Chloropicon primus]|nr:complex I intermediate-associated protein 30 [Chloropicon primus]